MTFEVPELNYEEAALEPHIDAKTMNIHRTKHHQAYTDKLNATCAEHNLTETDPIALISNINQLPEGARASVRNNGGGFVNHCLFWEILSPNGGGNPEGELADAINRDLGGLESFKDQFAQAAATRFGSGWAWLGVKEDGGLCVCSTPNQDNPLMDVAECCKCTPILGLDVWEHAYYLNYQNRRPDYIAAFWNVVDWDKVNQKYQEVKTAVA